MAPVNRRKYIRGRARGVAAHLQTQAGLISCSVENISVGGVFVRTTRLLPLGHMVELALVRPGMKHMLMLRGRVASNLETHAVVGMGIEFVAPEGEDAETLSALLKELGVPEEPVPTGPAKQLEKRPEAKAMLLQIQSLLSELNSTRTVLEGRVKELKELSTENESLRDRLTGVEKQLKRMRRPRE